jgi:amino acid adenylation domain-containing protein
MAKEVFDDKQGYRDSQKFRVPPNLIPPACDAITPEMLPLLELKPEHIERIAQAVRGGAQNIEDIYPLTPLQEGILSHHLLNGHGGDAHVMAMLLCLSSQDDLQMLIPALQAVIDHHEILRTAVLWEQLPRAVQVVYRRAVLPIMELVLERGRNPLEQVKDWMKAEQRRLNLREAPLMRLRVASHPDGREWYAVLQVHQLACDHDSLAILIKEVNGYFYDRTARLPESVPYRNHVAHALLHAKSHNAISFFREKLGDIEEPTAPFGMLDEHGNHSRLAYGPEAVDSTLAQRLRGHARRLGVSTATLFHAAWALVVSNTSRRHDVVFGTVIRRELQGTADAQRTLGPLINTLPLRLRLHGVTTAQFVEQTQRELLELLDLEQATPAEIRRCDGILGGTPLFGALLNYRHSTPNLEAEWTGAARVHVLGIQGSENYPIILSVDDVGHGFALTADTDVRVDPHRIAGYVRTSLQSLVDALDVSPETPALALTILPEHEKRQIVESFNATHNAFPRGKLIHELFEEQVERTPHAIAAVYKEQCLSYADLNKRANQMARHLRDQGIGPDQPVGIYVERGLEMIVGLLGVLKAGGAYLPLDPAYPPERLTHMLYDAAPRVLLTLERLLQRLPVTKAVVVTLDGTSNAIRSRPSNNLCASTDGLNCRHLVYIIYTSGSTGQPKGTAMAHHSMVNLIEWHRQNFCGGEGKRTLQFAALGFDVAFQEIFSTLCTGGTLVLLDEWIRRDARALVDFLRKNCIARLFVPPLMLQSLAECCKATDVIPTGLQDVVAAGEQLRVRPDIANFFKHLKNGRLHNHYGPTETHVVTALTLTGDSGKWPALPTIGCPISDARIYILNDQRQLVPINVTGEIYIAGAGVARGYLNRPDLTSERFLPDMFSDDPQARLYKTGDIGRWNSDGTIEYLGRNDHQVKIRGYRIELGEIEAELARHEQVKDAVVIAREEVPGKKGLVAYVVANEEVPPEAASEDIPGNSYANNLLKNGLQQRLVPRLREHLKARLPEYMIPLAWVVLQQFPHTPNGKVDRRSLPAPESRSCDLGGYLAPRTDLESTIAEIWAEALGVDRVGVNDNFFQLGGHSVAAMRLAERIGSTLRMDFEVSTIFSCPTVEKLALSLSRRQQSEVEFDEGTI